MVCNLLKFLEFYSKDFLTFSSFSLWLQRKWTILHEQQGSLLLDLEMERWLRISNYNRVVCGGKNNYMNTTDTIHNVCNLNFRLNLTIPYFKFMRKI